MLKVVRKKVGTKDVYFYSLNDKLYLRMEDALFDYFKTPTDFVNYILQDDDLKEFSCFELLFEEPFFTPQKYIFEVITKLLSQIYFPYFDTSIPQVMEEIKKKLKINVRKTKESVNNHTITKIIISIYPTNPIIFYKVDNNLYTYLPEKVISILLGSWENFLKELGIAPEVSEVLELNSLYKLAEYFPCFIGREVTLKTKEDNERVYIFHPDSFTSLLSIVVDKSKCKECKYKCERRGA